MLCFRRRPWARLMATSRRSRRRNSRDGFRQTAVVVVVGALLAAGLLAAGDYVVQQRLGPAAVKAFMKIKPGTAAVASASGNGDAVYTGSILYLPFEGTNCRQFLFDNRNGRVTDNGYVDCLDAEAQSGIASPKQWSAARVKVISDGFRDR
jgi:hypothetical protein